MRYHLNKNNETAQSTKLLLILWLAIKRIPSFTEFSTYRCLLKDEARVMDYSMGLLDAMMFFFRLVNSSNGAHYT